MSGFREFPCSPRAAARLGEDLPSLELRVRALPGGAEPRVGEVGLFLRFQLVLSLVRAPRPGTALVALVREGDIARSRHSKRRPKWLGRRLAGVVTRTTVDMARA